MYRPRPVLATLFVCGISVLSFHSAGASCPDGFGPITVPNVIWIIRDSVSACAAGDTIINPHPSQHPHPARLRIYINYQDADCNPKVNVPAESIWVTSSVTLGNVTLNDKSGTTHYPDYYATNSSGETWITFPSLSGCGKVVFELFVSGVSQGLKTIVVRSADFNADGRIGTGDLGPGEQCDLNYDSMVNPSDLSLVLDHYEHWHRNALHGGLAQRTNLCETSTCVPRTGESELYWSPNGRWLSFSEHIGTDPDHPQCKLFMVPSNPNYAPNRGPQQFTFAAPDTSDYDGSWSPLAHTIVFDRGDYRVLRKGIPGLLPDTSEALVTASGNFNDRGDLTPSVSPNGQWVAFSRRNAGLGGYSLWKVPISGGVATRLTNTDATGFSHFYPRWSPDGAWITYQQEQGSPANHTIRKVTEAGLLDQEVYSAGTTRNAATPAFSPDGAILTSAIGTADDAVVDTRTHTIDPLLTTKKPIVNFPGHAIGAQYPYLFPRLSPDGTRLGLITKQIWTAKQSMNKPPTFTSVVSDNEGTQSMHDTTSTMFFDMIYGDDQHITVNATDPEGDALTFNASFLQSWMTWNGTTRTLHATPPLGSSQGKHYVKFWVTSASGGTDAFIGIISVPTSSPGGTPMRAASRAVPHQGDALLSIETTGSPWTSAELSIFDLSGRKVAKIIGTAGSRLDWRGVDDRGAKVPAGVYLYRAEVGPQNQLGKVVVLR